MKIEIRPATLRDVTFIAANMRAEDWREISASCPTEDKVEAGALCFIGSQGYCWIAWYGDEPICAFGFVRSGLPWLWSAWAFGTERMRRVIPAVSRFLLDVAYPLIVEAGAHRCEVRSIHDHDLAHRWLLSLGATREAELPAFGRGGETFVLYSWTRKELT